MHRTLTCNRETEGIERLLFFPNSSYIISYVRNRIEREGIIKTPVEKRGWVIYRSINCRIMNEVNRQLDECRPPHRLPLPPPFRTTPPFISLYDGANEIFIASKISMPAALSLSLCILWSINHTSSPLSPVSVCVHTPGGTGARIDSTTRTPPHLRRRADV